MISTESDQSSFSEPSRIVSKHLHLDANVDFIKNVLTGFVEIEYECSQQDVTTLMLDTHSLIISKVESKGGTSLQWKLLEDKSSKVLGTPLEITLEQAEKTGMIRVYYETTKEGQAIQWLTPEQTSTKTHPYLFSQCQAIHARSMLPCQDTPIVKSTYSAKISLPAPLTALMSAGTTCSTWKAVEGCGGMNVFEFKQPIPVPSYLIALAAGNLASRRVGPRSQVWAEPDTVDKVAYEFANIEKFLSTGEEICGPYQWGHYDVLCLPPSFPYGGMENPCLTFATPTLLAGDRSLEDVIIHEITHSWTGNLVTNRGWKHFWLNEGWTMFVQRKIMEKLYGSAAAELDAIGGLHDLEEDVQHFVEQKEMEYTKLIPDLGAGDPDDAFSSVPYEKGFNFLWHLQSIVGGPKAFASFIKDYVKKFGGITLTSDEFKEYYINYFKSTTPEVHKIDWDLWFYGEGIAFIKNVFDQSLVQEVERLEKKILAGDRYSKKDTKGWNVAQMNLLLDRLFQAKKAQVNIKMLKLMDSVMDLSSSKNAEHRFRWQKLGVKAEWEAIIPQVLALVTEQGRMKFTRPLYRALYRSKMGRKLALSTFLENEQMYHPICQKMVRKDLEISQWTC